MSLKCIPLLFLNMGGEMIYILQQRLQAQNISEEKATRVLTDVLYNFLNEKFMKEIFKLQVICSNQIMRILFEKLANCSIMRLNETSMHKLYDLITMVCKYQLQLSSSPKQLAMITLNHLDGIRKILPNDATLGQLLDKTHHLVGSIDARVNVSILLRSNKQLNTGRFILFPNGNYKLPFGGNPPGQIQYFKDFGIIRTEVFPIRDYSINYESCESKVFFY
ncbi:unnamed protein product [Thelazia callipaeda]|uniref:OSCP1 n=1 Tax=Thelazia callipaeda TaxID=103827 RepID=A0A0N5CP87_THECL|nr:unnamed protein product [Thelazia callipaeda]